MPLNLHSGAYSKRVYAPLLNAPEDPADANLEVFALMQSSNYMRQGLYAQKDGLWQAALPQVMVSEVFTQGFVADVYLGLNQVLVVDPSCIVFRNGELYSSLTLVGDDVFCVLTPTALELDSSEFVFLRASQNLSGHRVVKVVADGADYASASEPGDAALVVGITVGATLATDLAKIQTSGELIEPSWNWQLGPVFNDVDGQLTQVNPSTGYSLVVGIAAEPTKLLISLKSPIVLN
jgi:hypothetical protein